MQHDFTEAQDDESRACKHAGCLVRVFKDRWQRKRGGHWRRIKDKPIPPCEGVSAGMRRAVEMGNTFDPLCSAILKARWAVDDDGYVAPADGGAALDISDGDWIAQAWAAGPDMARALLEAWRNTPRAATCVWGASVRAALLKAGVSEAELEGGK